MKKRSGKKIVTSANVPPSTSPVSQGTIGAGLVFVGGQMPRDPVTGLIPEDPGTQVTLSLNHCLSIVQAAGSTPDRVLIIWVYVTDLSVKPLINDTFAKVFGDKPPARNFIEVRAIGENAIVEFSMIALCNDQD